MSDNPDKLTRFWQELKRRKVIYVITVYASAAFVIIELVNNVVEPLNLPERIPTIAIIVLAIGFPIVVIISWIFDLTPKGMERTKPLSEVQEAERPVIQNRWKIATYVSIAVIIGLIVLNIFNLNKVSASLTQYGKSIAVLPFINDTQDKENDQFINGAMESILNNLSKIKDLRVVSRRSVEQYRDKIMPIPEVAEAQRVSYILEGSMQKYSDQIIINLQLIDQHDRHLWSDQFEREIKRAEEYFSFWSEIAQLVAEELKAMITPEETQLIQRIPTSSLTAQNFYQKGRDIAMEYYRERYEKKPIDTAKLNMAELLFLQALEYDSTFAPAYTELASVVINSDWKFNSLQIRWDSALALANKALSYDDQLSEAYVIRGLYYNSSIERDEDKALAEYNKALKYNPNHWLALKNKANYYLYRDAARSFEYLHQAIWRNPEEGSTEVILDKLIMVYMWAGFFDKAKYYSQEFLKLNRDSARYYTYLSWIEYLNRNYNKAIEHCNKRLAIDSTDLDAVFNLGANYIYLEDYEKSLKYIEKFIDGINASGGRLNNNHKLWIGIAYWKNGNLEMANYYLDQSFEGVSRGIERWNDPAAYIFRAQIYAYRGMKKKALEDLTVYTNQGSNHLDNLNSVKFNPLFDNIRDDPGFQQVLQRMEANYQATYEKIRKWLEENNML